MFGERWKKMNGDDASSRVTRKELGDCIPAARGFAAAHGGKALPFRRYLFNSFEAKPRIGGVAAN
jgi:hypothetical protein